jgi:hypothetical protein
MGRVVLRWDDLWGLVGLSQRWVIGYEPSGSTGTIRHASRARKVGAWFIIAQLGVAISSTHSHLIGDGLHLVYRNLTKRGKEPIRLDSHEWTQTLE